MMRPALFLDRDGVINIDYGYVFKPDNFDFIDGIFDLVAAANERGYLVIVITNQAGIGRGFYTESDFFQITNWMKEQFVLRRAHLDDVYFCPFHPRFGVGKYLSDSDLRKPSPGMLLQATREHDIDLAKSIFVGDKDTDMIAGQRAGVGTLLLYHSARSAGPWKTISDLSSVTDFLREEGGKFGSADMR